MSRLSGVVLDKASLDRGDLDWSALKNLPVDWTFFDDTSTTELAHLLGDAQIVISNKVLLDRDILQSCKLKLICVAATGYNNVDMETARAMAIPVCNVRAYATASVVQHVFMLLLNLLRNFNSYRDAISAGAWQRSTIFSMLDFPIEQLDGKILGIIGYGELGQAVAKTAKHFGMQVMVAQRPGTPAYDGRIALADLLPQVDVLSLHCALSEQNRGLIGDKELKMMQEHAYIINTARGGLIDEPALLQAFRDRQIAGAAVDVLEVEPPSEGSILLQHTVPNLIVTPHIAWASRQARQRLVDKLAENVVGFLGGSTPNLV